MDRVDGEEHVVGVAVGDRAELVFGDLGVDALHEHVYGLAAERAVARVGGDAHALAQTEHAKMRLDVCVQWCRVVCNSAVGAAAHSIAGSCDRHGTHRLRNGQASARGTRADL